MQSSNGTAVPAEHSGSRLYESMSSDHRVQPSRAPAGELAMAGLVGLGVGYIIGLTITPVMTIVVGSMMSLVTCASGILAGLRPAFTDKVEITHTSAKGRGSRLSPISLYPIAFIIIGMAIGTTAGIWTRTHNLLGSGILPSSSQESAGADAALGVLFNVSMDERSTLREAAESGREGELEARMLSSVNPQVREFAKRHKGDPDTLRKAVRAFLR